MKFFHVWLNNKIKNSMSQCIPIELAGMKTQLLLRVYVQILHQESLPLFSIGQILLSGKNHALLLTSFQYPWH